MGRAGLPSVAVVACCTCHETCSARHHRLRLQDTACARGLSRRTGGIACDRGAPVGALDSRVQDGLAGGTCGSAAPRPRRLTMLAHSSCALAAAAVAARREPTLQPCHLPHCSRNHRCHRCRAAVAAASVPLSGEQRVVVTQRAPITVWRRCSNQHTPTADCGSGAFGGPPSPAHTHRLARLSFKSIVCRAAQLRAHRLDVWAFKCAR
eukprot:m.264148 g.264148  ORF g.264148 m.264148 type:complete len:208 (+) comp11053_c2_seq16:2333-2956(+)